MEFDGEIRLFDQSGSGLPPVIPTLCNQLEFVLRGQVCIYFSLLDVIQCHAENVQYRAIQKAHGLNFKRQLFSGKK